MTCLYSSLTKDHFKIILNFYGEFIEYFVSFGLNDPLSKQSQANFQAFDARKGRIQPQMGKFLQIGRSVGNYSFDGAKFLFSYNFHEIWEQAQRVQKVVGCKIPRIRWIWK